MAHMTNEEFKKLTEDLENGSSQVDIDTVLYNFSQTDDLNGYDADALYKLEELLNNNFAKTTPAMRDAINAKISQQRQNLAKQAQEPVQEEAVVEEKAAEPVAEERTATPKAEEKVAEPVAEEKAETPAPEEVLDFDKMTSYDLHKLYDNARNTYDAAQKAGEGLDTESPEAQELAENMAGARHIMQEIEKYAEKELSETVLSEHNAPTVKDYVDILTAADENYKYENQAGLEAALADYDKTNDFEGELPQEKEILENAAKWQATIPPYTLPKELTQDLSLRVLSETDKETFQEMLETLRVATATELAKEAPDADKAKAEERYKEKFIEVTTQYMGVASTTIEGIMQSPEQQKKWWEKYAQDKNIPVEKIPDLMRDQEHLNAYKSYVVSNVYKTLNGIYTEKNAIYASRLGQKANMAATLPIAAQHKKTMWEKHPEIMQAAKKGSKNGALSVAMFAALGPIGLTAKQGWQLVGAFKKSYNNYAAQNEGQKKSLKGFFTYLKNNKEEAVQLAKQTALFAVSGAAVAAMAASGALTFGLVGNLAGFGATNAAAALAQAGAIKLAKMKVTGAITAVAGAATYMITQRKLAPKKKELMSILQQHLGADPLTTEKKGFFSRFRKNDPVKAAYKDLTKLLKNGDEKLSAKIDALNLPAEQKERVMQLAKEIKTLRAGKGAAVAGAFVGGGMMGGEYAQNLVGDVFGLNHGSGGNGGAGNWDPNKSWEENMEANKWNPDDITKQPDIQVPYAPGMQPEDVNVTGDIVTLPADSFEKGGDMWYATQMGPTVLKQKLEAMGFGNDMDQLPRGSHGAIPSRVMANYLKTANFTPEQAKELQDFVGDRQSFNAEVNRINLRDGYNPYAHTGGARGGNLGNGGNAGVGGNGTQPLQPVDMSQLQGARLINPNEMPTNPNIQVQQMEAVQGKTESGSWLKRMFGKKQDESFVIRAGLDPNAQAEEYAGQKAMADYNAKHPDAPITSVEEMKQHGYNVKGTVNGHKVHVQIKNDGNTEIRTVDGVRMRLDNYNGNVVARYSGSEMASNTVGYEGGKSDELLGKIRSQNGVTREYVRDGNSKYVYERDIDANGNASEYRPSDMSASKVKSTLKNYGKTLNNGESR